MYEIGPYLEYQSAATISQNQDRFEVLHEFNKETIFIADKILNSLNVARTNSLTLNL